MAQDRIKDSNENKQRSDNYKSGGGGRTKRDKSNFLTKVVVRRLPPTMTEDQFIEQVSPIPDHDYFYFVKADLRLGQNAFSRAYVNFIYQNDIYVFKDKFDGYVFVDSKGGEYPAIVEFAPFQKIPRKRNRKRDAKSGTIETDPDYLNFLENLKKPDESSLPLAETYLEEIEMKEKELRANNGVPKITTPLIEYLKQRKIEQQKIREEKREERKRKEIEKKRLREEERRRRKAEKDRAKEKQQQQQLEAEKVSKESGDAAAEGEKSKSQEDQKQQDAAVVQVLKNPEREKETKDHHHHQQQQHHHHHQPHHHVQLHKSKEFYTRSYKDRNRREWESSRDFDRNRQKDRNRDRPVNTRDKDHYSGGQRMEFRPSTSYKRSEDKNAPAATASTSGKSNISSSTAAAETSQAQEKKAGSSNTASTYAATDKNLAKTKRDKSCPGVVETSTTNQQDKSCAAAAAAAAAKEVSSASEDNCDGADCSKGGDIGKQLLDSKDPRTERRIRNKDRPSLEIYRPGLRRFNNAPRNSPQKEISTSTSNSSTPSPSPTPPLYTIGSTKVPDNNNNNNSSSSGKVNKTNPGVESCGKDSQG